jgi:hypothetical protein
MESNESLLNNDLQIDATAHGHLTETAKWAKFIAIAGFIFSIAVILFGLYFAALLVSTSATAGGNTKTSATFMVIFYAVIALVWFIVSIYHFRFASKLLLALQVNDQVELNNAFQNLRIYYRISGIVTIISLFFTVLGVAGTMLMRPAF